MDHVLPLESADPAVAITPEGAGWRHLTFEIRRLPDGRVHAGASGTQELCVVLLAGDAELEVGGRRWRVEGRTCPFEGLPYALYVPPGNDYRIAALGAAELAVGAARAEGRHAPRLITPDDVEVEIRGGHNVTRQITHLIDPGAAERLLCVEVYTPSGNWSSYPPHRHDRHDPPLEVDLDEVYHYRIDPPGGWALQRLYTDDRSLDEVVVARHGDTVLVRRGYHPVVAAPGYDVYYLNLLAGDEPSWAARDEPDLAWVRGSWAGREDRLALPLGRRPARSVPR